MTTFSWVFSAGVGLDTPTVEPTNRAAVPGRGVGDGAGVGGTAVALVSMTRLEEFDSGRTFCKTFSAERLMVTRGMIRKPAAAASPTTTSTTSTSPRPE